MATRLLRSKKAILLIIGLLLLSFGAMSQQNLRSVQQSWATDTTQREVPLEEFKILLKRDAIPPIDDPDYWGEQRAKETYYPHEPVILVEVNGEARAYPLSTLMFHEIVNGKINGKPLTITYCPLCNAALVFDRQVTHNGKNYLLDFGTSGMLRHSDLVMWDRQTESWWQQMTGKALVGELAGVKLGLYPSQLISLEEFLNAYPKGKVLAQDTSSSKPYGTNPYENYDQLDSEPKYLSKEVSEQLPPKARIVNVRGIDKIYPYKALKKESVINDNPNGQPIVLFYKPGKLSVLDQKNIEESKSIGSVTVYSRIVGSDTLHFEKDKNSGKYRDQKTSSLWSITGKCIDGKLKGKELDPKVHGHHFAFAWFSFHPDSGIYGDG